MFFPSMYPRFRSPCRSASALESGVVGVGSALADTNPIRGTFPGCCASAFTPHTVSATTRATLPANFRFWILDFRLSEKESSHRTQDLLFILFAPNRKSAIENRKLLDHLIRPREHVRRNRETDLL